MYSIIRFTSGQASIPHLEAIGASLNRIEAGIFQGIRRKGDGFAVNLSSSSDWLDHLEALAEFISRFGSSVREATNSGARVTFDAAIEPNDRAVPGGGVMFESSTLSQLVEIGMRVEITFY